MGQKVSVDEVRKYEKLTYRALGKLSALFSSVKTFLQVPRIYGSADIHLAFQSKAQLEAQQSLCADPQKSGLRQRVLVVIPFRDKWDITSRCLDSLIRQDLGNHEIFVILVDNGSAEEKTQAGIQQVLQQHQERLNFRHIRYDVPFNFSALNNWAIRDCADLKPDIIFLCNNDIEFIQEDSVFRLVNFCRDQENAGAVGCTLIYPDQKIQHLFVYVGSKIVGSHPHKGRELKLQDAWYQLPRPVGAVTGAITLMRYQVFSDTGGFDENLPTSYQDVDLCLNMQALGLVNWVVPHVVAIHHEGQTRGKEPSWPEASYIYEKWGSSILHNRFVHRGLNRKSEHYVLS